MAKKKISDDKLKAAGGTGAPQPVRLQTNCPTCGSLVTFMSNEKKIKCADWTCNRIFKPTLPPGLAPESSKKKSDDDD